MPKSLVMSLLFTLDSPPSLLYAFSEIDGSRILLNGKSLASGTFLFDRFICSGDLLFFSLYELASGETSVNRPQWLNIATSNFQHSSLFTLGDPNFDPDDFLAEPIKVPAEDSPFPGVYNLFSWSAPDARERPFQVIKLVQEQTFAISAKVIVSPKQPGPLARTYRFDPEMVVGPDDIPPPDPPDPGSRGV